MQALETVRIFRPSPAPRYVNFMPTRNVGRETVLFRAISNAMPGVEPIKAKLPQEDLKAGLDRQVKVSLVPDNNNRLDGSFYLPRQIDLFPLTFGFLGLFMHQDVNMPRIGDVFTKGLAACESITLELRRITQDSLCEISFPDALALLKIINAETKPLGIRFRIPTEAPLLIYAKSPQFQGVRDQFVFGHMMSATVNPDSAFELTRDADMQTFDLDIPEDPSIIRMGTHILVTNGPTGSNFIGNRLVYQCWEDNPRQAFFEAVPIEGHDSSGPRPVDFKGITD
ncbi:MAG: hypothetical protein WC527_00590 [Candidatus Margulisiibacteriota bacterium]